MTQTANKLCHLTDHGILKVSGADATKLLQGQLTCNVEKLASGESCLGAHCNPQGRILSLFYLIAESAAYYLIMQQDMLSIAMAALKKYAVFYKINIEICTEFALFGYEGSVVPNADPGLLWIKLPTTCPRYILMSDVTHQAERWDKLATTAHQINTAAWKCLNIQDSLPTIYPATSGHFLPHELNLPQLNAIDFAKGCYTGQEIIARMHYRGKLKTLLCPVKLPLDSTPVLGTDIDLHPPAQASIRGMLVDACQTAYNDYDALIIMRK